MKVILNKEYSSFSLSEEFCKAYPQFIPFGERQDNQELIKCIEEFGIDKSQGKLSKLIIFELPDEATDYYINKRDGFDELIYVINGKLNFFIERG